MQQNTEDQVPSVHSKKKWLLLTALGGGVLFAALLTVAGLLTHGAIKSGCWGSRATKRQGWRGRKLKRLTLFII